VSWCAFFIDQATHRTGSVSRASMPIEMAAGPLLHLNSINPVNE